MSVEVSFETIVRTIQQRANDGTLTRQELADVVATLTDPDDIARIAGAAFPDNVVSRACVRAYIYILIIFSGVFFLED